jgi:hypothetical protein
MARLDAKYIYYLINEKLLKLFQKALPIEWITQPKI